MLRPGEVWWSSTVPPNRKKMSPRMFLEIESMHKIFNRKEPVLVNVAGLGIHWDVNFRVITHSLDFNTDNPFEPYWKISFHMAEVRGERRVEHHKNDVIDLEIHHEVDYPHRDPKAYWDEIEQYSIFSVPHILSDKALCLFDHGMSRSTGWDPFKSKVGTIGVWSVLWIRAYWYYRLTGVWPEAAD